MFCDLEITNDLFAVAFEQMLRAKSGFVGLAIKEVKYWVLILLYLTCQVMDNAGS